MNNLPVKIKKESIFRRFINFFKNIFKKESHEEEKSFNEENIVAKNKMAEEYRVEGIVLDNIKKDSSKTMKEIIDIIEKNPETLEKLDVEKLELIDQYYVDTIAKYKRMLGKKV